MRSAAHTAPTAEQTSRWRHNRQPPPSDVPIGLGESGRLAVEGAPPLSKAGLEAGAPRAMQGGPKQGVVSFVCDLVAFSWSLAAGLVTRRPRVLQSER